VNVEPLRGVEWKALAAHLAATAGAMSLAEARGYLTAAACAPTRLQPGDWMPTVLGEGGFTDKQDAGRIFTLVMRLYVGIVAALDDGGRVTPTSDDDVAPWCTGYLRLAQTDPRWTADATGVELIIPIASLATGADMNQPDDGTPDQPMSPAQHARYRDGLHDCVRAIDLYWGARRPASTPTVVRAAPKVGRNEPCACGSGKKYKRCHGAAS